MYPGFDDGFWNEVGTQRWQSPASGGNRAGAKAPQITENGH
jgi:hypothetical protein